MVVAAVDVGTNTVRLLVCDEKLDALERAQRITRLGKGVDASGSLERASIERTVHAVAAFVARARELKAEKIRIAGTSALRDAANGAEFLEAVRHATGLDVEILDGRTEGRRAYAGATSWLAAAAYIVCDIGGGSTELITAGDAVSMNVGSIRIRERFCTSDPPGAAEIAAARDFARTAITDAVRTIELEGDEKLVGVAGTITTLAALVLGLRTYDRDKVHGSRMRRDDVDEWSHRLLSMPADDIAKIGPVQRGREDVIGTGSLILSVVMDVLDADDVLVSERDILEGLAAELVG